MHLVAADSQQSLHQPVLPVSQAEVMRTVVMAITADERGLAGHKPELSTEQLHAATDGGLVQVHGQGGPFLGSRQLHEIKDVQVCQSRWWPVGEGALLAAGVGPAGSGG